MNEDSLGLNHLESALAVLHTVRPPSRAASSVHFSIDPPQLSRLRPRCFSYHAARSAPLPALLRNTPPIPVTLPIYFLPLVVLAQLSYPNTANFTSHHYGSPPSFARCSSLHPDGPISYRLRTSRINSSEVGR